MKPGIKLSTPKFHEFAIRKIRGGKNTLWHAVIAHPLRSTGYLIGASKTAEGAIKDAQNQWRRVTGHS